MGRIRFRSRNRVKNKFSDWNVDHAITVAKMKTT